jgi:hypothetical protein
LKEAIINGFPNYIITNTGRVFSLNYNHTGMKKELKSAISSNGYKSVDLYNNGEHKVFMVHRLVAEHFIPNPDNLPQVNHRDGDKDNCNDWNLEWCTTSENVKHAYNNKLNHIANSRCVEQICDNVVIATFNSIAEASRITGVSKTGIGRCCRNTKQVTSGGYKWRFKELI